MCDIIMHKVIRSEKPKEHYPLYIVYFDDKKGGEFAVDMTLKEYKVTMMKQDMFYNKNISEKYIDNFIRTLKDLFIEENR